jgi:hypothetical protein
MEGLFTCDRATSRELSPQGYRTCCRELCAFCVVRVGELSFCPQCAPAEAVERKENQERPKQPSIF